MTSNDTEPNRSRFRWLLGGMGLLAIPFAIVWWPGCREYPPVTSREALSVLRLLNTACNTKDPERLNLAAKRIEDLKRKGLMTPAEQEGFESILELAKAGHWEQAERAAFKMAQDQVGVGHPSPERQPQHRSSTKIR